MSKENEQSAPEMLRDEDLDRAAGGLLLPAVQKVREAAARFSTAAVPGDGSV